MVSDIPAEDGKNNNLFLQCRVLVDTRKRVTYGCLALNAEDVGCVGLVEGEPVVDGELGDGGHPP